MKGNYDIREYARGDRRGKEANRLERQAVSDPFLHEALEGYREVGGDLSADIDRLGRRIARRAGRAARLRRIAVAAASAAVVLAGVLWLGRSSEDMPAGRLALSSAGGRGGVVSPVVSGADSLTGAPVPASPAGGGGAGIVPEAAGGAGERPADSLDGGVAAVAAIAPDGVAGGEGRPVRHAGDGAAVSPVAPDTARPALLAAAAAVDAASAARRHSKALFAKAGGGSDKTGWPALSGVVTDTLGRPLAGATVLVKGRAVGTVTDSSGRFRLPVPPSADSLVFSYVGMRTRSVPLRGGDSLAVALAGDGELGRDIVVTGYAALRRKEKRQQLKVEMDEDVRELAEVDVKGHFSEKRYTLAGAVTTCSSAALSSVFDAYLSEAIAPLADTLVASGYGEVRVAFRIDCFGRIVAPRVRTDMPRGLRRAFKAVLRGAPVWGDDFRRRRYRGVIRLEKTDASPHAAFLLEERRLRKLP